MSNVSLAKRLENAERDEARRTILREATQRFNRELMDDEERMLLLDRIRRLRRVFGVR